MSNSKLLEQPLSRAIDPLGTLARRPLLETILPYVSIARPDHWFKNGASMEPHIDALTPRRHCGPCGALRLNWSVSPLVVSPERA